MQANQKEESKDVKMSSLKPTTDLSVEGIGAGSIEKGTQGGLHTVEGVLQRVANSS